MLKQAKQRGRRHYLQYCYERLTLAVCTSAKALSPSEQLAARSLGSVLIVLLLCLGLWFLLILPFFVARKTPSAVICLGVSVAVLLSLIELRRGRVRLAIWIFTIALWLWAAIFALLSGGIRSVALLAFLPGFVTAATLLGQHVATVSGIVFLGFALVLALVEMMGIHLTNYFPFPPMTIWAGGVLTTIIVAVPLNQLLRFLRDALDVMRQQLSDLEMAAQGLRESEAKYRIILDAARDGIVLADVESGRILGVNPAAEYLSNGRTKDLQDFLLAHWNHAQPHGGDDPIIRTHPSLTEVLLTRNDGTYIPLELAATVVIGEDCRQLLIGVFRDISDRKSAELERRELEARLQQAERLETVGRLAGGVAHDFNNLLTVINGYSAFVLSRLTSRDENRAALHQILSAGQRAASLVQQLLAFSRKQMIQPRSLDLNTFLAEIRPMLQSLVSDDIELSLGLASSRPFIVADPGQIHQVVMNLVANARDAMPRGGKLSIDTSVVEIGGRTGGEAPGATPGRYVLLTITDTGIGIEKEVQAHLFEPFFTTKGIGKGTGLGLSTVYGIVQQNGGTIAIDSEVGKGTSFKIYLPAGTSGALAVDGEPPLLTNRADSE